MPARKFDLARFAFRFDAFANGDIGADQQITDDFAIVVAQRGNRHERGQAPAVLADVGQLVDILDFA
jgi:Lon protease-like protein